MPKGYSHPKNFSRFKVSKRLNLLFLQTFSFGVYNARLKLKEDKFRYSDVLTTFIVGEMNENGCKVSDFKEIIGSQTSVCSNILSRAKMKGIIWRSGGKRGRSYSARYYLTDTGFRVYSVLQNEISEVMKEAKRKFVAEIHIRG